MERRTRNKLTIEAPKFIDAARIEREARAYRNAYIAASVRRAWQRLANTITDATPAEHQHA